MNFEASFSCEEMLNLQNLTNRLTFILLGFNCFSKIVKKNSFEIYISLQRQFKIQIYNKKLQFVEKNFERIYKFF